MSVILFLIGLWSCPASACSSATAGRIGCAWTSGATPRQAASA